MSISGISGYSSYNYSYSTSSASSLNSLLQLSSSSSTSTAKAIAAVSKISSTSSNTSAYTDVTSFLTSYQSALTGLESAAAKLQSGGSIFTDFEAGSSDESVATASKTWRLDAGTDIDLEVQSIAQTQKNASESHYATESAEDGMDFTIDGPNGSTAVSVSNLNSNGTKKTYYQMYQEAAESINNASTGVKASVVNNEGKISLVLEGKEKGASKGFSVTGTTGAAAGIENAMQKAQDAVYTVTENGRSATYSSSSNSISLENGKINVELKKEGTTNIYSGIDTDKVADAVQDLVDSYNSVTNLLQDNSSRGRGTVSHLSSFERGMAAESTLSAIGITKDKEGNLVLDKDKLTEALQEDYEGTKDIISGQFGIAENAAQKADRALSDSVQRIVSNDLSGSSSSSSSTSSSTSDDFAYFASFATKGYNLSNYYAVGLLFNSWA